MERQRIVFSGAGGQGVITAGIILAEAAVLHEGLNATQAQSYGPEARGGATRSDVIISDSEIRYPKVVQPNMLITLTQEAYNKYVSIVRPGGMVLADARFVTLSNAVDARQIALPMHQCVMERIGRPIVFNICMLGALLGVTELVKADSILAVLERRIARDFFEINRQALELGLELGIKEKRNA